MVIESFEGIPPLVAEAIAAGMAPVKAFRQAEGRSVYDVGVAAGIDEQRMTDIENGAVLSQEEVAALARVLQVSPAWLNARASGSGFEAIGA